MNYQEQLEHWKWKLKRDEILRLDNHKCQYCKTDKKLNVHHTYYVKGRLAWDYPNSALITLCINCHELAHERIKSAKFNKERICRGEHNKLPPHISEVIAQAIKNISHA
ncbi:MAG TPA: HNH endonuclease [bacterium]|nr:HNH endonuclease [bacterium]